MARIPAIHVAALDRDQGGLAERRPVNFIRIFANNPQVLEGMRQTGKVVWGLTLDARLKELAIIQVGYITGAAYEYVHHVEIGSHFGVTEADIQAIRTESSGKTSDLAPLDRAVLRATRELTADVCISDDTFACLQAHLSTEDIVGLVMVIAYYNAVVRCVAALEVDLEERYQPLLEKFPLPH
jgi:alkylhydroperoxidase family enzyme